MESTLIHTYKTCKFKSSGLSHKTRCCKTICRYQERMRRELALNTAFHIFAVLYYLWWFPLFDKRRLSQWFKLLLLDKYVLHGYVMIEGDFESVIVCFVGRMNTFIVKTVTKKRHMWINLRSVLNELFIHCN